MTLTIPENDFGNIRVFSLADDPGKEVRENEPDALNALFGTTALNTDYVDVVDIAALDDLGLIGLLQQGYDVTPDVADARVLESLSGWAILIMSRATTGAEVTLTYAKGVTHVTTLGDKASLNPLPPLDTEAAKGALDTNAKPPKSDARVGGMVATLVLLFLFALVGLMIWVGR